MSFQIVQTDIKKIKTEAVLLVPDNKYINPGLAIINGEEKYGKRVIYTNSCFYVRSEAKEVMALCFENAFKLAKENGIESVAMGPVYEKFKFPSDEGFMILAESVQKFLEDNDLEIYFCAPKEREPEEFEAQTELNLFIEANYDEHVVLLKESEATFCVCDELGAQAPQEKTFSMGRTHKPAATRSLDDVIANLDKTFMELVFSYADEKNMTDVELQRRANLDRKAFSKLKCGTTKKPSKQTALALAIALKLNLDETSDLLARAGFALSPCNKQDVIVRFYIENGVYDIHKINCSLYERGEGILGMQAL